MPEPRTAEQQVPRRTRRFVYGFLGVLLLCGVASIEAWPFSGFKLFSALRDDERTSWQIVAVEGHQETPIILADLPVGFRNTATIIPEFATMTSEERDQVCRAWAQPARDRGVPVEAIRVYRKITILREDAPPTSELMWQCDA